MTDITLAPCTATDHAAAILEIFNEAIANSTALYDYQARTAQTMHTWFATKQAGGYPVIGAFDAHGTLLGFASWGSFRAWPAYKYTVEHSIYVHRDHRGRGIGRRLLAQLEHEAQRAGLHVLVGGIDMDNRASIALHEAFGFRHVATMPQVGFKFGRWLDLGFWQKTLPTPHEPRDG
jgi:phosphinothricin acetyltransferase